MSKRLIKLTIAIIWSLSFGISSLNASEILDSNCEALKYQSNWPNYNTWSKGQFSTKYLLQGTTISCREKYISGCVVVRSDNTASLAWRDLADNNGNPSRIVKNNFSNYGADYLALKSFRDKIAEKRIVVRSSTDDRYTVKDPKDTEAKDALSKIQAGRTETMFNWIVIFDAYQYIVDKVNNSNIDGIKNVDKTTSLIKKPKEMIYSSCAKDLYKKYTEGNIITEADLDGCFAYQAYCTENFALAGLPRDVQKMIDVNQYCINVLNNKTKFESKIVESCKNSLRDNGQIINANLTDLNTLVTKFNETMGTQKPQTLKYFQSLQKKYTDFARDINALIEKNKQEVSEEKKKQESYFYKTVAELTTPDEPNYDNAETIEQQMDVNIECLFSNKYDEATKFGCAGAIEYAFANNLLKAESEKIIMTKFADAFSAKGKTSKWAAIMLGLLANYDPSVSSNVVNAFKNCITDQNCPAVTKEGISKGWGYLGSSAIADIKEAINVLSTRVIVEEKKFDDAINQHISNALELGTYPSKVAIDLLDKVVDSDDGEEALDIIESYTVYTPGRTYVSNSDDANTATLLFHTLGYIYLTQLDYQAKEVLLNQMRFSCINNTYACLSEYSLTLGVNAAQVANYYGVKEAEPYLESIALWHSEHSALNGVNAIPIGASTTAWLAIPDFIRQIKNIQAPTAGTGEKIVGETAYILTGVRDALGFMILFEMLSTTIIYQLYGEMAAYASSNLAADIGYLMVQRAGGSTVTYEITLQLEQRLLAQALAKTTAGKVMNAVIKPIIKLKNKFGGAIENLKSLKFKNNIRLNPEALTLGEGLSEGGGSVLGQVSEGFVSRSTAKASSSIVESGGLHNATYAASTKTAGSTYQVTAADWAKFGSAQKITQQSADELIASMVPGQTGINTVKSVAGSITSGASQSAIGLSKNGILSTVQKVQIATAKGSIAGIQISSVVFGLENAASASINTLLYMDGAEQQVKMNIEYPDGKTVPLEGADINDTIELLGDYNKYCIAA